MVEIRKFITHSKKAISIAQEFGWLPGARYTNLRDIRTFHFERIGFIDIDWKNYDFAKHLDCVAEKHPWLTIARDVDNIFDLDDIIAEAEKLLKFCQCVAIVPKDVSLHGRIDELIPKDYVLAYSVPTQYGETKIDIANFDRPVHLLGGRPDVQRTLADKLKVISFDCNRFTYDARYGDYFDGEMFRPHPVGGYERCLTDSIRNINVLWNDYTVCSDAEIYIGGNNG